MTATLGRLVAFAGVPARRLVLTAALGVLAAGLAVLASWGLDPVVADHARGTDGRLGYL